MKRCDFRRVRTQKLESKRITRRVGLAGLPMIRSWPKCAMAIFGFAWIGLCLGPKPVGAAPPPFLIASIAGTEDPVSLDPSNLPKWDRIRRWMVSDRSNADPALADWAIWAAGLRSRPETDRLSAIDIKVNQSFRYASDMEVWGLRDYWETPAELVAKQAGDCEDFAIFKLWLAHLAGIADDRLQ